jgi:predicted Zn-dependent protease
MIKQRWFIQLIVAIVIGSLVWSCSTVPLTGRKRINLMPESEMISMSFTQYDEFLSENPLSTNATQTAMVKKVGKNIAAAVEAYFAQNGWSDQLKGFDWEFNLVADATPNAWCMPGGKVVFYEGILSVTQDEAGMAVVMGHEIAHAVARHGSERMTQQMAAQMGSTALSVVLAEKPEQTQTIYQTAFGVATQVGVILPFSRKHEYEADRLGLIFMSMAGYDPSVAVDFWTRMSALSGDGSSMTFMSTHPSNEARIRELKNALPEALSYSKE